MDTLERLRGNGDHHRAFVNAATCAPAPTALHHCATASSETPRDLDAGAIASGLARTRPSSNVPTK